MLNIKNAAGSDFDRIMKFYKYAREYMIQSGNQNQWGYSYPDEALIKSDISQNVCKVIYDENGIHGVFALFKGKDSAYEYVESGSWLNDEPYITIHKIDTHADNITMQKLIKKNGFVGCETIYNDDGSPRIAYHRSARQLNACG